MPEPEAALLGQILKNVGGVSVLVVALTALAFAVGKAAPGATAFLRALRGKNGNGHGSSPEPDGQRLLGPAVSVTRTEYDDLCARLEVFENLTNRGERLTEHFQKMHDHANKLMALEGNATRTSKRLENVESSLAEHREEFAEYRGESKARDEEMLRLLKATKA